MTLDEFLDLAARIPGVRIIEHPRFGGVTKNAHVPGSQHYKGNAADINVGPPRPGAPADEVAILVQLAEAAYWAGLNVIYTPWRQHPTKATADAHVNHLHVDGLTLQAVPKPTPNPTRARQIMAGLIPTPNPPAPPQAAGTNHLETLMANFPFMFRGTDDDVWTVAVSPTDTFDVVLPAAGAERTKQRAGLVALFGEPRTIGAENAKHLRAVLR